MVIWVINIFFLYCSSVYSCHLLISYSSVRFLPFLSSLVPIFAWNGALISPIFLKSFLVFPIVLFSSISLHCSFKKVFLSLLAILWNSAFSWVYTSLSLLLPFLLLFSSQVLVKPPQTTSLPSCISFFLGIALVTVSCTILQTSVHRSSGTLSTWFNSLNLFLTFKV